MFPSWLFELLSILAILAVLIPAPFHIKAHNHSAVALVVWLLSVNLFQTVNSFVWRGNVDIKIPVWCDIGVKIDIGNSIALPAACLCINRFLASVSASDVVRATQREKKHRLIFDISLCYGLPALIMILHAVFQGHRFNIYENVGCFQYTYNTYGSIIVFNVVPIVLAIFSFLYGSYAIFHLIKRRSQCDDFLKNSTNFTASRFYRLLGLTTTLMTLNLAFNIVGLVYNVTTRISPYKDWDYVHQGFSRIGQYSLDLMPQKTAAQIQIVWLLTPIASYIFFGFFGFGTEARKEYLSWYSMSRNATLKVHKKISGRRDTDFSKPPAYENSEYSDRQDSSIKDITGKTGVDFDQYELPFLTDNNSNRV